MYKDIIINTFDTIFKNAQSFILKLLFPTIILMLISYYLPQTHNYTISDLKQLDFSLKDIAIPLFLIFLAIMTTISIAITTHRISILGNASLPKFGSLIFGLREFKFLFKFLFFGLITSILVFILSFIPYKGILIPNIEIIIAICLSILLVCRLSFVYPAVSCDESISFYESWKYTRGHTFLMLFAVILFPLIFSIAVTFIYSIAIGFFIKGGSPYFLIYYSFLNILILIFSITALSSAYLLIKPRPINNKIAIKDDKIRDVIEKEKKESYKLIIHDKHKVTFKSLKKELEEFYSKLGFTQIAYDRENNWLLTNNENSEAYISLRYDNNEYTIQVNKIQKPKLKILAKR